MNGLFLALSKFAHSFDKTNVFRHGQLPRGNGAPLAIAPDDTTVKCMHGRDSFEVLQEAYAERRLA